jgi:hypothetical protein
MHGHVLLVTGISNPAFNGQTDSSITEVLNNTTNNIVPVTYSIIPTNKGCTGDPFFYTASIKPTPTAPVINNSTPICAGTPLSLFTNSVTGASYQWSGPNGFSSTQQNPVLTNVTTASAGIYQLKDYSEQLHKFTICKKYRTGNCSACGGEQFSFMRTEHTSFNSRCTGRCNL